MGVAKPETKNEHKMKRKRANYYGYNKINMIKYIETTAYGV
jgi:hypothetical protein